MFIFPNTFILSFWWIQNLIYIVEVLPNRLLNKLQAYSKHYSYDTINYVLPKNLATTASFLSNSVIIIIIIIIARSMATHQPGSIQYPLFVTGK